MWSIPLRLASTALNSVRQESVRNVPLDITSIPITNAKSPTLSANSSTRATANVQNAISASSSKKESVELIRALEMDRPCALSGRSKSACDALLELISTIKESALR